MSASDDQPPDNACDELVNPCKNWRSESYCGSEELVGIGIPSERSDERLTWYSYCTPHPVVCDAKRWYTPLRLIMPGDSKVEPSLIGNRMYSLERTPT